MMAKSRRVVAMLPNVHQRLPAIAGFFVSPANNLLRCARTTPVPPWPSCAGHGMAHAMAIADRLKHGAAGTSMARLSNGAVPGRLLGAVATGPSLRQRDRTSREGHADRAVCARPVVNDRS